MAVEKLKHMTSRSDILTPQKKGILGRIRNRQKQNK